MYINMWYSWGDREEPVEVPSEQNAWEDAMRPAAEEIKTVTRERSAVCAFFDADSEFFAYRWDGTSLTPYTCDDEGEWNGQLGCGNVTEVLRYADIQSKSVQIDTLDGLL